MNGPYLATVLVTGSRRWDDVPAVDTALSDTWHDALQLGHSGIEVLEGGATGADSIAKSWARRHVEDGVGHQQMAADWDGSCADTCKPGHRRDGHGSSYCPQAGHRRNQAMVDTGPAVCLAFIAPCDSATCRKPKPHDSHGVAHCMAAARTAGVPVREVRAA
jgi:hypothetical protein